MSKIETGVDKLVELINTGEKISVEDAAKKLGISKVVVQEWASFLEEEKIISIDYKFSKTFLIPRKLTEKEVKEKKKEYTSEKDAFVRKVESSLKSLDSDSLGLEKIKNEFKNLKKDIGGELASVKTEVEQLEKYEYLKKNLDKDIEKQVQQFNEILDKSHEQINIEQKKHQQLVEQLDIQKRDLEVKEHRLLNLEEKEKELYDRIQSMVDLSKEIEKKLQSEKSDIDVSEDRVLNLQKSVREIEKQITNKKKSLEPLINKAKKHEEEILKLQEEILKKASQKTAEIQAKVEEGGKAMQKFEKFFEKKTEIESFISDIEKEQEGLKEDYESLKKKALSFDLASKSNTINTHVKEMEKQLEGVNQKKGKFKEDLEKLIKLIKG